MKRILNVKHWQLFLLVVIPGAWTSPSPLKEIINSIAVITFLIWIYSIGKSGHDKLKDRGIGPLNFGLFKINILLIPILIVLIYLLDTGTEDFELIDIITVPATLYLLFAFAQT